MLERYPEFVAWRTQTKTEGRVRGRRRRPRIPEETIASSFELLNSDLAEQIVARVHAFSPAFFERLIIDLLVRMGYGGGRAETGRALGRVGDGGVDGVINQDALGLDVVYVQAKRLDPDKGVPVREVRDFVGGLEGHRATKGVFVTTSYFPVVRVRFHRAGLQARRADRRLGARRPHDPPPGRREGEGHLRTEEDRRGLFRRVTLSGRPPRAVPLAAAGATVACRPPEAAAHIWGTIPLTQVRDKVCVGRIGHN